MTPGRRFALAVVAVVLLLAWGRALWRPQDDAGDHRDASSVVDFLSADATGEWSAVTRGRPLSFPRDHGAHPDFRQEWWYYTGNLQTRSGRRFGFQLTFFRFAHGAFEAYSESAWRHDQSWMAHLAVSDVENKKLIAQQDYARGVLGLAGAVGEPFSVWVNGWSVRGAGPADEGGFSARLAARADPLAVNLDLRAVGPPLLQGEAGFSAKDAQGRTASYYYSLPNIEAAGTITLDGQSFEVAGRVWMDREWSTEVLSKTRSGWDWFALRLSDAGTLMAFQVRGDGDADFRYAIHVDAAGRATRYDGEEVMLRPARWWRSEATSARYPVAWALRIDKADIDLAVTAAFADQVLDLDFEYWEGVVDVTGSVDNEPVDGAGYLELTGY